MRPFSGWLAALIPVSACICMAADDAHVGQITDLKITRDRILSCSQAGVFTGSEEAQRLAMAADFRIIDLAVYRVKAGSEGGLLVAGGEPGISGVIGQRASGNLLTQTIAEDMVYSIAVSPDALQVAAACADGRVLVCKTRDVMAPERWSLKHRHTAAARVVEFSPDGKWLASAGLDGVVVISMVDHEGDGEQVPMVLEGHTAGIDCLSFSPDSESIASGSRDSKVRIHQVSGKLIRSYCSLGMADEPIASRVPARVLSMVWGEQHLFVGTSKGSLHWLSLADDRSSELQYEPAGPITALAIDHQNGQLLIADTSIRKLPLPVEPFTSE